MTRSSAGKSADAIGIGIQFRWENRALVREGVQSAQQRGDEAQTLIESGRGYVHLS